MNLLTLITKIAAWAKRSAQKRTLRLRVQSFAQIDPSVTFDTGHKTGSITVGSNVTICQGAILAAFGGNIVIEDNVYVGPYSVLYGHGGLTIGRNTQIAAHCVIIPSNHNFDRAEIPIREQGESSFGIEIGEDCWLGAGVKVLDGVVIENGSVIAAGAVVNKSIPEYSVAAGVPARVIRSRRPGEMLVDQSCSEDSGHSEFSELIRHADS